MGGIDLPEGASGYAKLDAIEHEAFDNRRFGRVNGVGVFWVIRQIIL